MPDSGHGGPDTEKEPIRLKGRRVCVAAPHDFTEACFSVPAVRALRDFSPEANIAVLCPSSQLTMWQRALPELDHVLDYKERASVGSIASKLKVGEVDFDAAIVWEAGKAVKALSKAGVAQRVGYASGDLEKWLTETVSPVRRAGPIEHRVRHYLGLMKQLGANAFVKASFATPSLPPPPGKISIALAPLSEYGASHQWPLDRFLQVIDMVNERYAGVSWTIFDRQDGKGGGDGLDVFEGLLGEEDVDASENWESEGFFDQLAACSVLLACDGELAHMAALIGLPATVIFGPNSPEWKRPVSKQSIVVREHVACSPCYLKRCPLDHRCQNDVTVEMVVEGLERAIRMRHATASA